MALPDEYREYAEIDCVVLRRSPAAVLLDAGTGKSVWIPKVAIANLEDLDDLGDGEVVEVLIGASIAADKGLV